MTTPGEQDIGGKAAALRQASADGNRPGTPDIRLLVTARPSPRLRRMGGGRRRRAPLGAAGRLEEVVEGYLDRLADRVKG